LRSARDDPAARLLRSRTRSASSRSCRPSRGTTPFSMAPRLPSLRSLGNPERDLARCAVYPDRRREGWPRIVPGLPSWSERFVGRPPAGMTARGRSRSRDRMPERTCSAGRLPRGALQRRGSATAPTARGEVAEESAARLDATFEGRLQSVERTGRRRSERPGRETGRSARAGRYTG
jgi:hypothetical protein